MFQPMLAELRVLIGLTVVHHLRCMVFLYGWNVEGNGWRGTYKWTDCAPACTSARLLHHQNSVHQNRWNHLRHPFGTSSNTFLQSSAERYSGCLRQRAAASSHSARVQT